MSKSKQTPGFSLANCLCSIFGHRYKVSKKVTPHVTEFQCSVCKCEKTTDDRGHIVSLTPERKEINNTLAHFYRKRHRQALEY
ncbi:hypothetical protein SAMN04487906_0358 [Zhouia amylolytica]|uniref:Prophage protein n=1 Tax=Zhouia amylolytica TaxID=376730 RepID=A0A1I6PKW0_9FLAO|nr:hypothetical protein [Zhouia amylolytica]SFS40851.1 hypothetical protein SAMN04487906_0358 [Zhouia amylolytica]